MHTMMQDREHNVAIVGIGGAGCNFVNMFTGQCDMDTIAINTDKVALHATKADKKVYICKGVLHGEGAQGNASLGRNCADIHIEEIREAVAGYDKVFVVTGLGGGTGTGAAPVVIDAAQSQNIMTFAVAIKPFSFEGEARNEVASRGYNEIRQICPYSMAIKNEIIAEKMADMVLDDAFMKVNEIIMGHIESCVAKYDSKNLETHTGHKQDGFDSFVRGSPICAYTA